MSLSVLLADLENVVKNIAQSLAAHNVLLGQKQGLEHAISVIQNGAQDVAQVAGAVSAISGDLESSQAVGASTEASTTASA